MSYIIEVDKLSGMKEQVLKYILCIYYIENLMNLCLKTLKV